MRQATVAAMPNAHSHAFQRDLRALGERTPDDFWSWRTQMLHLAQALDPESMQRVAAQVYGEMLAAGYGAVGEFHYVHHRPDGTPYEDPNALAIALAQAATVVSALGSTRIREAVTTMSSVASSSAATIRRAALSRASERSWRRVVPA